MSKFILTLVSNLILTIFVYLLCAFVTFDMYWLDLKSIGLWDPYERIMLLMAVMLIGVIGTYTGLEVNKKYH